MKKQLKLLITGLIVALTVITTIQHANAQGNDKSVVKSNDKVFVGLLFDQFASDRWQVEAKYLSLQLQSLGAETTLRVAHSDASKQVSQAKELIDAGVDMLIVISVDATESMEIVEMAKEKGVYVVAYDRPIFDARVDLYFSFDSKEVGRLQAKAALEAVPKGNYVLVNGPSIDNNAVQIKLGQMEVLSPLIKSGDIKILADLELDSWHEMTAMMALLDLNLDKNAIDCIISAADILSTGVVEYLEDEAHMRRIYITGQDANPNAIESINQGYQNMTILKPLKTLAINSANHAYALAKNKSKEGLKKIIIDGMEFDGMLYEMIRIDTSNVKTNVELREQLDSFGTHGE